MEKVSFLNKPICCKNTEINPEVEHAIGPNQQKAPIRTMTKKMSFDGL